MADGYSGWLMGCKGRYLVRKVEEWREKNSGLLSFFLSKFCHQNVVGHERGVFFVHCRI